MLINLARVSSSLISFLLVNQGCCSIFSIESLLLGSKLNRLVNKSLNSLLASLAFTKVQNLSV